MKELLCPKCGVKMEFMAEAETGNDGKTIKYFYRCPACGTKIIGSTIEIKKGENSSVLIKVMN
ncbi:MULTISPECIES: hypothetical protein [Acidianus]|uniref:Uncharacterized protein n=1 Tax=Candidatus Acidianus copahuensis TaxID=1160895 RepID=A0A031LMP0_9CREN|nr:MULTISPECIES: hypothetical protein [Acidianus]EZQ06893.1 hypothetical protein CM19_05865 [Candidatus Acidianus copahuensis]NON61388.1 hypothetical protein [Acidianus sp. RZ1]